jgi:hypothetical protein
MENAQVIFNNMLEMKICVQIYMGIYVQQRKLQHRTSHQKGPQKQKMYFSQLLIVWFKLLAAPVLYK